jgi:hypothetical protein
MYIVFGDWGGTSTFETKNKKNINEGIDILDEVFT